MKSRRSSGRIWFHRVGAIVWALLLVPALKWWPDSVAFVIVASIYANIKSDWGAAEAADDREVLDRLDEIEALLRHALDDPKDPL
jgi:hypothetical protein